MSQINTLRPVAVQKAGAGTPVPSGTVATVTADNSDATYVRFLNADFGNYWSVRVASHTPAAGYQRHRVRARIRCRTNDGEMLNDIDLGRGTLELINYDTVPVNATFTELIGSWYSDAAFGLATPGALADLNTGGSWPQSQSGGATELRTSECYVDIDCRLHPDFDPQVRDAAGVDRAGGTVTDTTQPVLFFGTPAYDDLPPLDWAVSVTLAGEEVFATSGTGTPPAEVPVTVMLANGDYEAAFTVRSTIRAADPFAHTETLAFEMDNVVPPPSPPLLEVIEAFGGYQVSWSNPGGQEWDPELPLVAEIWRDDCTGSQRIATIPDGLNGSYLDLAIPQIDTRPDCDDPGASCDITYRVRYWGYVSTTVEIPDVLPVDLILAWPGTIATIPDGWTRVTSLDGYHPRGTTGVGAPSATGGSASHTHTTPNHRHTIGSHSHGLGGNSSGSGDSQSTARRENADVSTANQSHTHTLPERTGTAVQFSSGLTAPGTNAVDNDPPTRDVIWIRSDGTRTAYPIGILGYSAQNVSGWTKDTASNGRFLRGAAGGANGGLTYGSATHTHTVASHTHTGASHDHTIANTGLSNPEATTEAFAGSSSPRFLPRHTHLMNVVPTSTGNLIAATGGTTGAATREPLHRRLRILRNTSGGAQTRIIGLYTGTVAALNPILTLCDGRQGTPDMRGMFCRDIGTGSVNTTGGANTHTHSTPNHDHLMPPHLHDTQVGASQTRTYERQGGGDQGNVPTTNHTHDSGNTFPTAPPVSIAGAGTSGSASTVPPYREVHFVRVDGTVAGGDLPVPELRVTEFASITVPAFTHADDLDRLSSMVDRMAVSTDRSSTFARLVVDSVPLDGGVHTVANTLAGEELTLVIAVEGLPAIARLESILAADRVYWSPLGGTPGWFAPAGWSVSSPVPNVKVVQVPLTRQPWPATPDPEEYL